VLAGPGEGKSSSGRITLDFAPNPDKTFNRGYTTYFFTGRGAEMASPHSPKHVGEPLGSVQSVGRDSFTLDAPAPLRSGDGITFYDRDHELEGSLVNRVQGQTVFPQKLADIAPGARVFRNHDHAFVAEIARSRPSRKIVVDLGLRETAAGLLVEATDEDGISASAGLACAKVPADKPDQARADVAHRLAKLGDTEFTARDIDLAWTTPLHLAASQVNGLRRALAENLAAARAQVRPTPRKTIVPNDAPFPEAKLDYRDNVLNGRAMAFYRRHGVVDIEPAAESGLAMKDRVVMTARYCLKYELGRCPREPRSTDRTTIPEPWFLVDDEGRRLRLCFRCETRDCLMEIAYEG
jgi:putative protease